MIFQAPFQNVCFRAWREAFFGLLARVLIFACFLLSIRPALPALIDQVAHRYYAEQHFSLVHAHGGKNHVHTEVQKTVKEDGKEGKSLLQKISIEDFSHSVLEILIPTWQVGLETATKLFAFKQSFSLFSKGPEPPPPWGNVQ